MGEFVETVAPTAVIPPRCDPPSGEPPAGDWYVKLLRKRDHRKYFIHRDGHTTARCDHIMLLPEELARQLAAAIRKNHRDFTAVAKKCPKRFLHPEQGKPKKKKRRPQPILAHAMEDLAGLLPCPFCGGQPFLDSSCSDRGRWFSVRCANCNAQTDEKATAKAAVHTWNRRFQSKQ